MIARSGKRCRRGNRSRSSDARNPTASSSTPKPADAHAAQTEQERFGKILRRNMPFGTFTDHGTTFVGFCADQARLQKMLESMAGLIGGQRDALTNYTRPVTGAYYFVPAIESLAPPDEN